MSDFGRRQTEVESIEADLRTGSIDAFPRDIGLDFFDVFEATETGNVRPLLTVVGPWRLNARLSSPFLTKSAAYVITDTDPDFILVTTGAASFSITLPTLADNQGRTIVVFKLDAGVGVVTTDGEGAETINGSASVTSPSQYDFRRVFGGPAEWLLI